MDISLPCLSMYLIFTTIRLVIDNNVSLIEYTIQGEKVIMWKRSTRSIYIQVLFFSICGIWTLIKDKKMELMMFATGNIYRKTNTGRIDEDDDIDDDGGEEEEDKEKNIINKISSIKKLMPM